MITFGLSVAVPVVDNSAAMARLGLRIARDRRIAERACDFANTPFARADRTIQDRVMDLLLDNEEGRYTLTDMIEHLAEENGEAAPTQATWEALDEKERQALLDDYVESDCRTGMWEFNPWGSIIERNNPLVFQPRRYGLSIETDQRMAH